MLKKFIILPMLIAVMLIATIVYSNDDLDPEYNNSWDPSTDWVITRVTKSFIDGSAGKYIFTSFYGGLDEWLNGGGGNGGYPNYKDGIFDRFASQILNPFSVFLGIALTIYGLAITVFGKGIEYFFKVVKVVFASIIFITFLDWNTFAYWIYDPMLESLIGVLKIIFNVPDTVFLPDAIFGVDVHFNKLFGSIEEYTTRLEEKGAWYKVQIFKQILAYLIVLMFGALYAIFTILIIVGFFGYMMLLGFAPIFMAIGVFKKGIFFAWVKTTMNYFLIPVFTASVMSITSYFIVDASHAISLLEPADDIFTANTGLIFLVGVFSIGLHWKAPEFAAAITGGMASGAGSIVGTAAAVGGAGWGLSKTMSTGSVGGGANVVSGFKGNSMGNANSGAYKAGAALETMYNKYRTGGVP